MLNLLDDTPVVPGEEKQPFQNASQAQTILNDAETTLRGWQPALDPIHTSAGKLGANAMPGSGESLDSPSSQTMTAAQQRVEDRERSQEEGREGAVQPAYTTTAESTTPHSA